MAAGEHPRSSRSVPFGLYDAAPLVAFFVELLYGLVCWRIYRGGRGLLAVVVLGNVANLSLLSPNIPGPERFLAGRPLLVVTLVVVQIVVTLVLVGVFSRRREVLHCPLGSHPPIVVP
jgi:hypothetical protein